MGVQFLGGQLVVLPLCDGGGNDELLLCAWMVPLALGWVLMQDFHRKLLVSLLLNPQSSLVSRLLVRIGTV